MYLLAGTSQLICSRRSFVFWEPPLTLVQLKLVGPHTFIVNVAGVLKLSLKIKLIGNSNVIRLGFEAPHALARRNHNEVLKFNYLT